MKMGKLFAVVGAVLALASVANACNGDLVIENSQDAYFDGTYSISSETYSDYPVWKATQTLVGSKALFRSSHPAGLWALQDSTAADPSLAFYAYAVSTASSPDLVTPGAFNQYLASATISCLAPAGPAPEPVPAPAPEPPVTNPNAPQQCLNKGHSAVPSEVNAACHTYCGCSSSTGICNFCCKFDGGYCYRGQELPIIFQSASGGFSRACDTTKCTPDKAGNGQCDGACNNPDCGWDGGECCKSSYPKGYTNDLTHPLHCQSDTQTEDPDYWRIEYHKPSARKHVRNQGTCGSCYAFATTTAINYQQAMSGDSTHYEQLSPQFLDSCYTKEEGGGGMCVGGIVEYNAKEITASSAARGIPLEKCFPYVSQELDSTSAISCTAASAGCTSSENTFVKIKRDHNIRTNPKEYYSIPFKPENIPTIKAFLRNVGPLAFRFDLDEAFQNDYDASNGFEWDVKNSRHAGLYSSTYRGAASAKTGGHAMTCTGYGHFTDRNGVKQDYFVFENSWGYAPSHDIGYVYWSMADTQAYALLNAAFVAPGASRVAGTDDAYIYENKFCSSDGTCGGDIGANAGRKLLGVSSRTHQRFSRRLLADGFQDVNADGLVKPLKGAGEIEETECTRPNAMDSIAEAVNKITEVLSQATGLDINVDLREMKNCLSQASAAENFFFDFTINVDQVFRKDVQINITKLPAGPCLRASPENPDKCADELGDTGLRLSQFKFNGVLFSDDGTEEFKFGGLPDQSPGSEKTIYEIHNYNSTIIHQGSNGVNIDFWQVVGAVVVGGVLVVVFVALVRVIGRKLAGPGEEEGMYNPMYQQQQPPAPAPSQK
eukprot:CAMPEP_0182860522 /NCGR_PEP_ID=MMETSP0034_2-20130328/4957_1 /TAXON_ID=156128 /ORGANISM="Nephroselmis pyriformis, Strain CCMP717" /LENGTH=828 /DNA_ID=CAMNT_0024992325 /DNA_START=84 /DNA_END=2570 /DNA_ORIENTATION=-